MREADRRLATLLEDVARDVEFPETPPLAATVRRRIESGPLPVARIRLPRTRPAAWRPVLATVAVVVVALTVTLALSVTARRAVADLLGIVGIHVTFDEEEGQSMRPRSELYLGEPTSTHVASERAGFEVVVPSPPRSRRVWAVYYDRSIGAGGMVSLVHPPDARSVEDVDLLVTQFVASLDGEFFKKIASGGADVRYTRVGSSEAFWIGGDPHLFYYVDEDGEPRTETVRLAGRVLLWEDGGITYRVEGADSLRAALRIARSLR
ncbi:MAG: hypothetical protein M3323_07265 [Actinomycetota bacterium]|nr:hypothetical protein [Actinomycetota bacterium]